MNLSELHEKARLLPICSTHDLEVLPTVRNQYESRPKFLIIKCYYVHAFLGAVGLPAAGLHIYA